jgi:hypothetical protein
MSNTAAQTQLPTSQVETGDPVRDMIGAMPIVLLAKAIGAMFQQTPSIRASVQGSAAN